MATEYKQQGYLVGVLRFCLLHLKREMEDWMHDLVTYLFTYIYFGSKFFGYIRKLWLVLWIMRVLLSDWEYCGELTRLG